MWMESSEEEERMFLVGIGPRPRRYGTTTTPHSHSRPNYAQLVYHPVQPSDTLQGLALKYNSSMTEIRRLNKLWSNDSIYLKDMVVIPILGDGMPSTSQPANNGTESPRRRSSTRESGKEEKKDDSLSDILSRIDATIKSTAQNVRKLERSSTVDRVLEEETEVAAERVRGSRGGSTRSARAQLGLEDRDAVRAEGSRVLSSLSKLQAETRRL